MEKSVALSPFHSTFTQTLGPYTHALLQNSSKVMDVSPRPCTEAFAAVSSAAVLTSMTSANLLQRCEMVVQMTFTTLLLLVLAGLPRS